VPRTIDSVRTTKIEKVVQESSNIRSLIFKDRESLAAMPGQFVMVWLPGVGEFPMSVSLTYRASVSIVVKAMGEGSKALFNCARGDLLGIRGPYGNSFVIPEDARKILLVGGGTGIAPILRLAREVSIKKKKPDSSVVIGARSKKELSFLPSLKSWLGPENVYATTDDGTLGFKGFAHEQVGALLEKLDFDLICCCGPEAMMLQVFNIATRNKIAAQFSLERIMKCGIAICGSCCIQDLVLCREGPVLNTKILEKLSREFGKLERDKTGTLVKKS
jgi:dihydroorotate dehydrogenase electron transfer subunit